MLERDSQTWRATTFFGKGHRMPSSASHRLAPNRVASGFALAVGGVVLLCGCGGRAPVGVGELAFEMRDLGRLVVVGGDDLMRIDAAGSTPLAASSVAGLSAALDGHDAAPLLSAMRAGGVAGLVVDGRASSAATPRSAQAKPGPPQKKQRAPHPGRDAPQEGSRPPRGSLREQLHAYAAVPGLVARYVSPTAALYVRGETVPLAPRLSAALGRVARSLLEGARPPSVRSFPAPLRRPQDVEVMVMIEVDGRPRLWRSARSGSLGRGLLTAANVAQQRWRERERAMGGPLAEVLPRSTVRVVLLREDGTLGDRAAPFIEKVFTPAHGVAFESRGSWQYLLPEATRRRGRGSAMRAYRQLLADHGRKPETLRSPDVRLYRLVATELATSPPPRAEDAPSGA